MAFTKWAVLLTLVAAPMLSAQQPANSGSVEIRNGFFTGAEFLDMSASEQSLYAPGLVDGILLAPLFGAPKNNLLRIEQCITGMTNMQVAALLTAHLKAHPEEWHRHAHAAMYRALKERCPQLP